MSYVVEVFSDCIFDFVYLVEVTGVIVTMVPTVSVALWVQTVLAGTWLVVSKEYSLGYFLSVSGSEILL